MSVLQDNELRLYDPADKIASFTIEGVTRKNAGTYKCTASNGPDMVDTKTVEVHVHCKFMLCQNINSYCI